jgi:hypothetical protein
MSEPVMSHTGNDANLPSDAVLGGYAPIYYSNTSPEFVWVTCFDSLTRLQVEVDSKSQSVRVESVRFWNSSGLGRYELQLGSISTSRIPVKMAANSKTATTPQFAEYRDAETHELVRVLRVPGDER